MQKRKLGIIALHPIQYQDKLWETVYHHLKAQGIASEVLFLDSIGWQPVHSKDFGSSISFGDIIKLHYPHRFLYNLSPYKQHVVFGRVNPGLVSAIAKYDAILLHGINHISNQLALSVAQLTGIKLLVRGEGAKQSSNKFIRKIKSYLFKYVDVVLYSCTGNKKYFQQYNIPADKLLLFPCAVDNDFFQQQHQRFLPEREAIRSALGIGKQDVVIISMARFVELKRPYDILAALAAHRQDEVLRRVKVLLVGGGPLRQSLAEMAARHQLRERLILKDFQFQSVIGKFFTAADIFMLPSSIDRSPKSLNEALNFALPVITTDVVGTAPDLVKHDYNGFLVKVGDVAAMARYIKILAQDSTKRKLFGQRGRALVDQWNFAADAAALSSALQRCWYSKKQRSLARSRPRDGL